MKAKAVPWVVSESDIEAIDTGVHTLEKLLHKLGMDVSKGFTTDNRHLTEVSGENDKDGYMHRSAFTGQLCLGPRYVGLARQDHRWKRFTEAFVETHAI
tara:strand:+ start:1788 stop:2084 length:297 start_codon:yes stop_codon:yes gene_type:complete